ncbi:hypothetical protein EJ03DRAFT_348014 [Teratosphaeria nubilosa]|uniref:RING-type domain-containing protein n=1 Tax=Teratosphaeria nubilosa TaxID=161662 RepID=A0A6G1LJ83_9PEZI|nr:hypothetical protein EJ03DRAFT_348014 [Teratosphaeria nubilosa]
MAEPAAPTLVPDVPPLMPATVKLPPPASPTCIACCEETKPGNPLLIPCRSCDNSYCLACVTRIFTDAIDNHALFPPKCCCFLQIHTALAGLTDQEADNYRQKLEEYLTIDKVYCPSQRCSTLISERLVPPATHEAQFQPLTVQTVLEEVVKKAVEHPTSRFIRARPKMDEANGLAADAGELRLSDVEERVKANAYVSAERLTLDISLIVANSKAQFPRVPGKPEHAIYKAADDFFNYYTEELSFASDKLAAVQIGLAAPPPSHMFTCPKCHIGICIKCRRIQHGTSACDNAAADQELAMLEQFGYKRCPLCKHAVKKMHGCNHLQCRCGAHWCYRCQRSIDDCKGNCADEESDEDVVNDEESDEDVVFDEEDESGDEGDADKLGRDATRPAQSASEPDAAPAAARRNSLGVPVFSPDSYSRLTGRWEGVQAVHTSGNNTSTAAPIQPNAQDTPSSQAPATRNVDSGATWRWDDTPATRSPQAPAIRNLDSGGTRQWEHAPLDFGAEPLDQAGPQIWSCPHDFVQYIADEDGQNHGDLTKMECNRCFCHVEPLKANGSIAANNSKHARVKEQSVGLECTKCKLVVCVGCRKRYYKNAKYEA